MAGMPISCRSFLVKMIFSQSLNDAKFKIIFISFHLTLLFKTIKCLYIARVVNHHNLFTTSEFFSYPFASLLQLHAFT